MAENNELMELFGNVAQAIAQRPVKTGSISDTLSVNTPYAQADMVANRNRIGIPTRKLEDALKTRENFGYSLAKALSGITSDDTPGGWLAGAASGFGTGYNTMKDLQLDRAKQIFDAQQSDLDTMLKYDKEMGSTTNQHQTEMSNYTEMPWGGAGGRGQQQQQQDQVPLTKQVDWDYWIQNWDEDRTNEAAYRSNTENGRALQNWRVRRGGGSAREGMARQDFEIFKDKNYLPMARAVLKGTGPITDYEDSKYTKWLSEVRDPVQLKDLTVRIIDDVARKNGWTDDLRLRAYNAMGVLSDAKDLTPAQIRQNPLRVRGGAPIVQMPANAAPANTASAGGQQVYTDGSGRQFVIKNRG